MNYILTISSQGQINLPSKLRKATGIKPGDKITASLSNSLTGPEIKLKPDTKDWIRKLAGSANGAYGKPNEYLDSERTSWDRV